MRRILVLAGALACLPLSAHAQSGAPDWDRRGDVMRMGGHDDGDWDSDHGDRGGGRSGRSEWSRHDESGWRGHGDAGSRSAQRDDSGGRDGGRDDSWRSRDSGRGGWRERRMDEGGMSPEQMRMHGEMMRRMMRQGEMGGGMGMGMGRAGARFMLRAGDVRLGVQCSPGEPMKACVDAAISLMDRAKTMAPSGSGSGTGPGAGSSTGGSSTGGSTGSEPKP
jgi:hypothetical protein